ncbi:MAG TPA: hypothetical protein VFA74_18760 [Terriglobales bacterium]|nr:hypothetical protein [Terriglobales bacterium]
MKRYLITFKVLFVIIAVISILAAQAQEGVAVSKAPARMTITLAALGDGPVPEVNRDDVTVNQGKEPLRVTGWEPARGDRAGLDLFILIDDACDKSLGSQLDELRTFITAQPPTTSVGVGYMRNATVQIAQNFTTDHTLAAKALRLPAGSVGAFGSPYLSAVSLMKGWPQHANRRALVLVTDGIDRARRGTRPRGLSTNPDVNSTSTVGQRTGTIIYGIYAPGVGHLHRNFWEATNGQNDIARLAEETGGQSFFLGLQAPVSFRPYLDDVQKMLDNQYVLTLEARRGGSEGLRPVSISTKVPGVELIAANSVWVGAGQ